MFLVDIGLVEVDDSVMVYKAADFTDYDKLMKMICFLFFSLLLLESAWANVQRFDNFVVYRLTPKTDEQVQKLLQLQNSGIKFDFWRGPTFKNAPVDIMVSPNRQAQFAAIIKPLQIDTERMIDNVQRLIDESTPSSKASGFGWSRYQRLSEIYAWLDTLALNYPEQVSIEMGGKSYEGRDIKGVRVSFKEGNKAVFLEAGIHAREWIAPATVTFILNELLTSTDPAVRDIAESYDWYIFPSVNPDGYEYSHTENRLWRMTRQPHGDCIGVDPNRNWAYHWNEGGTSGPCEETYLGPQPFSEVETRTLSDYITSIHRQLVGYLAIHSYSQLLLIPYGYNNAHVENYSELMEIGEKVTESLAKRYGTRFVVGNMAETIYVASGVSADWVKGNFNTPITYTYELRDTGKHGFVLPPEQIIPTAEETLDSLVTMMQEAKARGYV